MQWRMQVGFIFVQLHLRISFTFRKRARRRETWWWDTPPARNPPKTRRRWKRLWKSWRYRCCNVCRGDVYFLFHALVQCFNPRSESSGQKHKKKKKAEVFNFSAIHLIHDPQGRDPPLCSTQFVSEVICAAFRCKPSRVSLFLRFLWETLEAAGSLQRALRGEDHDDGAHIQTGWNPRGWWPIKDLESSLYSQRAYVLIVHFRLQLFLFNFYPFVQRFLQPHQRGKNNNTE